MGIAEKIAARVEQLPQQAQAEVLDFVEFLALRTARSGSSTGWSDAEYQQFALDQLAKDDDPVTYDVSDCREAL